MLCIWGLWCFTPLFAQTPISVTDLDGQPVVGAHVVCTDSASSLATSTDIDGMAVVPDSWFGSREELPVRVSALANESREFLLKKSNVLLRVRMKPSVESLKTFVVTGQYRPEDPRKAVQRVRVVTAEQIEQMSARNISDVLVNEFNIRLGQDNILGSSISMQGLSGQNVKILIDGVPVVGRQDGNIDLSQLLLSGVERIEMVEGPLSVNYGTNALAGTINIITRNSESTSNAYHFRTYAEHIGKLDLSLRVEQRKNKSNWSIDLSRNFFAGWSPGQGTFPELSPTLADSSRFQQWKPRVQFLGRLNYGWRSGRWTLGYKGEYLKDHILNRGHPRQPDATTAFDETYRTYRIDNALFADRQGENSKFTAIIAHNRYDRLRNTYFNDLTTLDASLIDVAGSQDTSSFYLTNGRFTYASIKDSTWINWEIGADLNNEVGAGARVDQGNLKQIVDLALFASLELEVLNGLIARPGLRYAYNSAYDAPITPALNLRWRPNDNYTIRASIAQGFRAPSLKELYLYFVDINHNIVGNDDLVAENSNNGSLSAIRSFIKEHKRSDIELALSLSEVKNMISLVGLNATEFSYRNLGKVRVLSGRLSYDVRSSKLRYRVGGGFTARTDFSEHDGASNEQFLSPEASASVSYAFEETWKVFAQYRFQGEQRTYQLVDGEEVTTRTLGSYDLVELNVSRRMFNNKFALTLGCKDLFDQQNVAFSSGSTGHDGSSSQSPLTTGRTIFVQLNLDIE